jgi:putative sterol carrier protein
MDNQKEEMMTVQYCTKEWLQESYNMYGETPRFREALKKVTTKVFFRIKAEPSWGIDDDFLFGANINEGELLELCFYSESEAKQKADFILSASPQVWKTILQKEKKFVPEFLTGKVTLEHGSKAGLLLITPYANHLADALTQFEVQFPDEMTEEELEKYRADLNEFREKSGL